MRRIHALLFFLFIAGVSKNGKSQQTQSFNQKPANYFAQTGIEARQGSNIINPVFNIYSAGYDPIEKALLDLLRNPTTAGVAPKFDQRMYSSLVSQADTLQAESKDSLAYEKYRSALLIDSSDANVWYSVGTCARHLGRNKDSIRYYKKCLALTDNEDRVFIAARQLIFPLIKEKQFGEALKYTKLVDSLYIKTHTRFHNNTFELDHVTNMALCYLYTGELKQSRTTFLKAMTIIAEEDYWQRNQDKDQLWNYVLSKAYVSGVKIATALSDRTMVYELSQAYIDLLLEKRRSNVLTLDEDLEFMLDQQLAALYNTVVGTSWDTLLWKNYVSNLKTLYSAGDINTSQYREALYKGCVQTLDYPTFDFNTLLFSELQVKFETNSLAWKKEKIDSIFYGYTRLRCKKAINSNLTSPLSFNLDSLLLYHTFKSDIDTKHNVVVLVILWNQSLKYIYEVPNEAKALRYLTTCQEFSRDGIYYHVDLNSYWLANLYYHLASLNINENPSLAISYYNLTNDLISQLSDHLMNTANMHYRLPNKLDLLFTGIRVHQFGDPILALSLADSGATLCDSLLSQNLCPSCRNYYIQKRAIFLLLHAHLNETFNDPWSAIKHLELALVLAKESDDNISIQEVGDSESHNLQYYCHHELHRLFFNLHLYKLSLRQLRKQKRFIKWEIASKNNFQN